MVSLIRTSFASVYGKTIPLLHPSQHHNCKVTHSTNALLTVQQFIKGK